MTITLQNDILGISTDEQDEAVKTTCQIKGERRQRKVRINQNQNDGEPEDINKRVQFDNRGIKLADLSANQRTWL